MIDAPPVMFFGHHKCGTRWILRIIADVASLLGTRWVKFHRIDENAVPSRMIAKARAGIVCYTNAALGPVLKTRFSRGFHVIRDPRDIIVSAYFSHLNSHSLEGWPALKPHRARLRALSMEEGLFAEIDFIASVFKSLDGWDYARTDVLELKLEDLIQDPVRWFCTIFEHLRLLSDVERSGPTAPDRSHRPTRESIREVVHRHGFFQDMIRWYRTIFEYFRLLPDLGRSALTTSGRSHRLTRESISEIVHRHSFSNLAQGRQRGEEGPFSHYRKGISGDWRNRLTPAHLEYFEHRHPGLVTRLGYPS